MEKFPPLWWGKNNGTEFTLPYKHAHRLLRVNRRSNIDNVKAGYVYPYGGKRIDTFIPEKIELNRETGVFFGLYIAEGDCDFGSGMIRISNNEPEIQEFVQNWFDKYSVKWQTYTKKCKLGNSTSIRGFSRILATLFEKLFGKGAANKRVPSEAFTAPDEFIIGLIDGYFSGDGTVDKKGYRIAATSVSQRLLEEIGMLCSRLGVFCTYSKRQVEKNNLGTQNILPTYILSIPSLWAKKFSEIVNTIHKEKNKRLSNMKGKKSVAYCSQCDVVLDKIISIDVVSVEKYPRLYDITVPKTLNFRLGNGLQLKDTAESGYISRRLIKALEDVKILYDGTVRNASNNIVQFIYGDDGYDPIKLERVLVDLIKYNNLEMEDRYKFDLTLEKDWENIILKSTMKELLATKDYKETLQKEYEMMVEYRDKLRNVYFVGTDVIDIPTFMPFNLYRFIPAVKYKFNIGEKSISDLNPIYVINRVKELCDSVTKYMRDKNANELTKIIIKSYLSPKMVIVKHKLNKMAFDYIIKDLEYKILAAFVQPGEMVGPVSAQSLGEVSTQLTLNNH